MPQRQAVPRPNIPLVKFDIVALATSAGGLQALSQVLSALSPNFPAPILVVQHLEPHRESLLGSILSRRTGLIVKQAQEGECLQTATVYIAPPNWHLCVSSHGILALSQTPLLNFVRPSADHLFTSVAQGFGKRAIAVVLTGKGQDGAAGITAIKQQGGVTIAQDPASAEFIGMPTAAVNTQAVDLILPLDKISAMLTQLVGQGRTDES